LVGVPSGSCRAAAGDAWGAAPAGEGRRCRGRANRDAAVRARGGEDDGAHRLGEDEDATGPLAELYAQLRANSPSGQVPDILRTMSLRPDFLGAIAAASRLHFSDGALTRAQHEMIAAYVAALNRCHY
jgi:hypothetical protein